MAEDIDDRDIDLNVYSDDTRVWFDSGSSKFLHAESDVEHADRKRYAERFRRYLKANEEFFSAEGLAP